MNKKMAFCDECRKDVEYIVIDVPMFGKLKGNEYMYSGKEAHCTDCNSLLYVPEINDANLRALYDVYRNENGIVPLSVILTIPEKYAIGKRPLSLLLGWGEQTFSRYCDGDIPTKQYSETLLKIYNEPAYFSRLLEAGKENLKSKNSYEKSRKAVDLLLGKTIPKESKIDMAARYLVCQCEDITPLALHKALYYIQGFYYAFYKNFLFAEDCETWVHGPIYRDIYTDYRDYHFDANEKNMPFDVSILTASEKAVFDGVIHHLCCYSGKILEQFTHNEAPWLTTMGDLPLTAHSERIIPQECIGEYFTSIKEKYKMIKPSDIRSYALDMFQSL